MLQQETSFVPDEPDALLKPDYQERHQHHGDASNEHIAEGKSPGTGGSHKHTHKANTAALRGAASFKENVAKKQKKKPKPVIFMYE